MARWQIYYCKQEGKGSYRARRFPDDNEVQTSKTLDSMISTFVLLRSKNPAFFYYKEIKYIINIFPDNEPAFPEKIKIEYPGINEIEYWTKANENEPNKKFCKMFNPLIFNQTVFINFLQKLKVFACLHTCWLLKIQQQ